MKRLIGILLAACLFFAGCGAEAPEAPGSEGITESQTERETETAAETASAAAGEETAASSEEPGTVTEPETSPERETDTVPESVTVPETVTREEPGTSAAPKTTLAPLPEYNRAGKRLIDNRDPEDPRPSWNYEFNPHVISELDVRAYGESIRADFFAFCDAVLAGEDSFPCSSEDNAWNITVLQGRLLPFSIFVTVLADEMTDGRCPLSYQLPKEEFLQTARGFQADQADMIAEADLREGDSELERAAKLYTMLSLRTRYDYSAMEDDRFDLSAYRTLMSGYGICQEIAPAYAYLLLQVGVEANTCGALAKDVSFAHEWTLVRIGGEYYHADVTYQLDTPYSLRYFLQTDGQRDGDNMDVSTFNIGDSNVLWHKDVPVTDETYVPLQAANWYRIDHETGRFWYYTGGGVEERDGFAPEELTDFLF